MYLLRDLLDNGHKQARAREPRSGALCSWEFEVIILFNPARVCLLSAGCDRFLFRFPLLVAIVDIGGSARRQVSAVQLASTTFPITYCPRTVCSSDALLSSSPLPHTFHTTLTLLTISLSLPAPANPKP